MYTILIADDDETIAMLIADALGDEGFQTIVCHRGDEALRRLKTDSSIDLALLDIMMPGMDGLNVLRRIRDQVSIPILFVTARNRTYDTIEGLGLGADDYIAKPFVVEELVARIKAHLRREHRQPAPSKIVIGEICVLREDYEVTVSGRRIDLTTREFQLLSYLAEHVGQVLARDEIFHAVWGTGFGDESAVAVYIRSLRQKLGHSGRHIKTIWGVGYQLVRQIEESL